MILLTVKKVTGKDNAGTTFSTPKSIGFDEKNISKVEAVGADCQFVSLVDGLIYLVDETQAAVMAACGAAKAGVNVAVGIIDMADAGQRTIAAHYMKDSSGNDLLLPKGAIIIDGIAIPQTTFTSATDAGTIALGIETESAAGLKAAIAISNGANPWDAGAKTALIPVGTAASAIGTLSVDRKAIFTVAVEALLLGKMEVLIMFLQSRLQS